MVKQITKQEIKNLLDRQAELCISIYMPIYKTGSEGRQNPIRFKNLISKAIDQLLERGMSLSDAENMLQPAKNILNNEMFWREQSNSFVVFCSRKFFECYSPEFFVEELVVAGNQFYIKPLLAYLLEDTDFFVLALSKNHLKLLSCNPFTYQEVELKNVPKNLKEALRFNDPERVLQFHTNTPRTPGARAAAIFHGHGVGIDDEKDDLLEYFRQIDRGVHLLLKDKKTPLVLASVDYFHPLYKKMNTYANLFEKGVSGNTELLTSRELYQKGREVLMPFLQKPLMQALAQYDEFAGTDRVSKNIQEILKAAKAGKVWNLFLQPEISWWGKVKNDEVCTHDFAEPGDEEILNLVTVCTIQTRGNVFPIERDSTRPAVFALFRY